MAENIRINIERIKEDIRNVRESALEDLYHASKNDGFEGSLKGMQEAYHNKHNWLVFAGVISGLQGTPDYEAAIMAVDSVRLKLNSYDALDDTPGLTDEDFGNSGGFD